MRKRNTVLSGNGMSAVLIVAVVVLVGGCKSQELTSHWPTEPVAIDGSPDDWSDLPTTYFETQGVVLGLSNDSTNLRILFRFRDIMWAQAIHRTGLTLWLDVEGKKNKIRGIRYKGGPTLAQMQEAGVSLPGGMGSRMGTEQQERLQQQESNLVEELIWFDEKEGTERLLPVDGSLGPAVAYGIPKGVFTYEIQIPLQAVEGGCGLGASVGQTIGIGTMWGEMGKRPDRGDMPGGMGGGPPPGGVGGGRPGGMGGGLPGGGGMGGPGMQRLGKQEIWMKTQLASRPEPKE
ncbi:MAG: hypothetical protein OEW00_03985 [candidate division Zixibacteria bacterium]|nr:hypothetical protein [candidate division Zixibacteria bacterium]